MFTYLIIHTIGAMIGLYMLYRTDIAFEYLLHKKYPRITPVVDKPDRFTLFSVVTALSGPIAPIFGLVFMITTYSFYPSFKEYWWAFRHAKVGINYNV